MSDRRSGNRRRRRSAQRRRSRVPRWLRRRRYQVLLALGMIFSVVLAFVWIAASRLGSITHQSAFGVIGDIVGGGGGSSVGQAIQNQRPITIALYGYGGSGHDGAFLSDSIMVVVVTPRANAPTQVAEISIPRDWEVPIDLGNGSVVQAKINSAYAFADDTIYPNRGAQYKGEFGRANLADDTLDKLLNIHIDHHVGLDFHAFQYAVDAVGGVDVNVERTFTDTQYPNEACDFNTRGCANITVHFNAGPQHMDGAAALEFARSRHGDNGEGTDFARSKRQQLILAAVRQKIGGIGGIPKILSVLGALQGHVDTDMTAGDAEQLYNLVKNLDSSTIEHVSVDDTNFLYECGYPTNCGSAYLWLHDTTYRSIRRFMAHVTPDPAVLAEHARVTVEDASGDGGAASAMWAHLLTEIGFTATNGGSVPLGSASTVTVSGAASKTAAWMADYFQTGTPASPTAAAGPVTSTISTGTPTASAEAPAVTLVIGRTEVVAFNGSAAGNWSGSVDAGYVAPTRTPRPTARPVTPAPTPTPPPAARTSSSSSSVQTFHTPAPSAPAG